MTYTTIEQLHSEHSAMENIIPYKDWVIVAFPTYRGIETRIFKSLDTGENIPFEEVRYLEIYEDEDQVFEDQGHAVKWGFNMIEVIAQENAK